METENTGCLRTVDEMQESLKLAGFKENELNELTQVLYMTPGSRRGQPIKLLELDDHLLATINKGDTLKFQGNKRDSVVLCTKNRTYDIKEAETSNACLLVPNLKFSEQTKKDTRDCIIEEHVVSGIFHTYYEVRECKPKLEKLLDVLEPSSFKGPRYESTIDSEILYDWNRLQSEVQASEDELRQALNDYFVVNIDGYYRLVSFEYDVQSLTHMLDFFEENSWEIDEVDKELTYETLCELISPPVFEVLFSKYTKPSDKSKPDGTPLYRYNEEKCCKSLAKVLLSASAVTEFKQFMESWGIGTPEKMEPKEEYLSGIALVKYNSSTLQKEVMSFPEADLPKNINERFNELFKAKDKWLVHEIAPYISNLTTNKMDVNALLTKYARCSLVSNVKCYSSKHGK